MTVTLEPEATHVPGATPRRARVARARTVLIAAAAVAALSVLWLATGGNPVLAAILVVAALVVVLWGTAVAMRRGSKVLAPLAVILVAVLNPLVLGTVSTHLDDRVGRMTVSSEAGLVFWQHYPGIAGWDAPATPTPVDTTEIVRTAQTSFRAATDTLSAEHAWTWQVGEVTGLSPMLNGFGGMSMFHRIDVPVWSTTDFDGSDNQRALLLDVAAGVAEEMALPEVSDPVGDIETGNGVRAWSDDLGGTFRVAVDGAAVSLEFSGGPYFSAGTSLDEYAAAREQYAGLEVPEPLFVPELP